MNSDSDEFTILEKSALALLHEESFLSSGCSLIDTALEGGFSKQGITQIYGESGTGKSQIALQLCLSVQQQTNENGGAYGAVYICTEAAFPVKRLQQMLSKSNICKKYSISTDRIFIENIRSVDDLESYLSKQLLSLLNNCDIGVIIIDSIAAPFTGEYENEDLKNRAISLRKIGFQLHNLSRKFKLSIICINQVRADLSTSESVIPALGIAWENSVTNSIQLFRDNKKRFAQVMISPYLPRKIIQFKITDGGIEGVEEM